MSKIKIAKDFSTCPAGRDNCKNSAVEFRTKILIPALEKAIANNETLIVDLDGTFGIAHSFLDEAFSGLILYHGYSLEVVQSIQIVSDEEPQLVTYIQRWLKEANVYRTRIATG